MRASLKSGLSGTFRYTVPMEKTVPYIYQEAADFQVMPRVFATGYMVALCEWACIELIKPHLDWPREQSVGTHVDLSHTAATPPGFIITVATRLEKIDGRKLTFRITAHDGVDQISEGRHERYVIDPVKFNAKLDAKRSGAADAQANK
jgi:fluoroacetyl-CoA thioesterase